jgi:hypothetical protein
MDTWVRVSARLAIRLDLQLVRGGTRSIGYRQCPLSLPQERQRIHK